MTLKRLTRHHAYHLRGMKRSMWQVAHPVYGKPSSIVGVFIGMWDGTRNWYGFEIRVRGEEKGMIFIPQEDLDMMTLTDLGPYHGGDDAQHYPGKS
jgi:hypothetical protein